VRINYSGGSSMPINRLYGSLRNLLVQLRPPKERQTRIRNFSWLLAGLFLSSSVHLSKIANKIPTKKKATLTSTVRRLSRLLDNGAICVRAWYEPLARRLLECQAKSQGEIRLIVDGTKVGFKHRLLMVGLAYRRRALPIAWSWVRSEKGHSSSYKQRALLEYVHKRLLPEETRRVLVVGDSEFGAIETLKQLEKWGWYYVMRQKSSHLACSQHQHQQEWRSLGELIERKGEKVWLEGALLSRVHAYKTNLLLYWRRGEKEPWLLATNLASSREALLAYKKRMWIEEMFADFKGHGFDLESTQLRRFGRLSRLTLAVAMLYVWLVEHGAQVIKRGQRRLIDRSDRRDYSVFRLGCNMLDRHLAQTVEPPTRLLPRSLPKLSGG
jgi:hypothetical protein